MKHDDFVIPFGYNKDKTFREVSLKEIDGLIAWLERMQIQEKFKDLYEAAIAYLVANHYDIDSD